MYRILKPINGGLSVVIREFQNFVKKTGLEIVKDMHGDNIPQQFIENVLQVILLHIYSYVYILSPILAVDSNT